MQTVPIQKSEIEALVERAKSDEIGAIDFFNHEAAECRAKYFSEHPSAYMMPTMRRPEDADREKARKAMFIAQHNLQLLERLLDEWRSE